MHSTLKLTLLFALGLLVGAAVAIPGTFFLLVQSPQGQGLIRSYIVSSQQWPDASSLIEQSGAQLSGDAVSQFLTTTVKIGVPAAYGTEAYATALNSFVADIQAVGTSTIELGKLLVQINNQSLSGDFGGFFDLIVQAKSIVSAQRALSTHIAQDVAALNSANVQVPDAVTRSLSQELVVSAQPVPQALNGYLDTLDKLLSGAVPSAETIQQVGVTAKVLGQTLTAVGVKMSAVTARFKSSSEAR